MIKHVVTTGFALFSVMLASPATAEEYSKMYVFGDSLSDIGNVFNVTTAANQLDPNNPINPPSPPYFEGRYSNGPVWVEYLADSLKLNLTPSTELAVGSPIAITPENEVGVNFSFNGATATQSVNFAFGGATLGLENASDPRLPGVLREIQAFTDDLQLSQKPADPNALYIVWGAGSNDVNAGLLTPATAIENISHGIRLLYAAGARNIMVPNSPDLGMTAGARDLDANISYFLTLWSLAYNFSLAITLDSLNQSLEDVNIILLDVNSVFQAALANPAEFGLTNVTEPCLTPAGICENPDEYLFWDDIHPTTAVHAILGEMALSALKAEPMPALTAEWSILALLSDQGFF